MASTSLARSTRSTRPLSTGLACLMPKGLTIHGAERRGQHGLKEGLLCPCRRYKLVEPVERPETPPCVLRRLARQLTDGVAELVGAVHAMSLRTAPDLGSDDVWQHSDSNSRANQEI